MTDVTITRGARRAATGLFILTLIVGGANLLATFEVVHANQGEQQRQGQALERKLCTTFGKLAALKPPAGNPAANPSRAFEDRLHTTLDQLGIDLGCP